MGRCSAFLLVWAVVPTTVGSFGLPIPSRSRPALYEGTTSRGTCRDRRLANNSYHCGVPHANRRKKGAWLPPLTASSSGEEPASEAEETAEAILRRLSPSELEGTKARLGLDDNLQGDDIIEEAVPILAAKIRARAAAQEVGRSAAVAAEYLPEDAAVSASSPPSAGLASAGDWVGEDGVERGWVGEKGKRRWVGAPGEKPPRQRHANREPERPLAPGERSYFATCPRYDGGIECAAAVDTGFKCSRVMVRFCAFSFTIATALTCRLRLDLLF